MIVVGWDPGKSGALVATDVHGSAKALRTPIRDDGKTYDARAIADWLRELPGVPFFAIEDTHAMPAKNSGGKRLASTHSNYQSGLGRGVIEGILGAMDFDVLNEKCVQWIPPRRWQALQLGAEKRRAAGTTKALAVARCLALFPELEECRGPRGAFPDGVADAAMLAATGRLLYPGSR